MSQQNTANSNRPPLPPGFRLTEPGEVEYVIKKPLSTTGGFGITYLATELFMKRSRTVVVKENYPKDTARRNQTSGELTPYDKSEKFYRSTRDKFLREAQIIRHLEHPNIVRVYSAFEALGTAYYTMPYLEGAKELWQAAPTPDKIDEAWLLPILQKLLGALAYLHDFELLHRDLKTNNIMLLQDGTPIIIDFGIARSITAGATTSLQIGTPGFSPPEQGSSSAGYSADLYSLAATCYHLLTGKIPPVAQDRLFGTDPYQPLSNMAELRARFSNALLSSIDHALRPMPADRWQSAQEWMAAIAPANDSTVNVMLEPTRGDEMNDDELYANCANLVIKERKASTSMLQRRFSIGYGRAAKMMDMLEARGIIEPNSGNSTSPRKVLIAEPTPIPAPNKPQQAAQAEQQRRGISAEEYDRKLHDAAKDGDAELVKLLIDAGTDVNKANANEWTPLCTAAANGRTDCVKLLINAGADVNKADEDSETPLFTAAANGHAECMKLLIDAGADVNKVDKEGWTPLSTAALEGHTECVKLLINVGADVNMADKYGWTPLFWAAWYGRTECVKLLITAGADVNKADKKGVTPLYMAAKSGCTECVKLLLDAGADVNKVDEDGYTPLYKAEEGGHTECAELLRAAGNTHEPTIEEPAPTPKITQQAAQAELQRRGISAREYDRKLLYAAENGETELVKLLIAAGTDVNKADMFGETPLYKAADNGRAECVKLLINAGADVNKANDKGETPLIWAAIKGRTEYLRLLLAAGADVNWADKDGKTPLYWAAYYSHAECVKLLIAVGADVNKASHYGSTPLYYAAYYGHAECVKLLIDAGADVNKADKFGETPLYKAEQRGHTECAELLRAAGGNTGGIVGFCKRLFS